MMNKKVIGFVLLNNARNLEKYSDLIDNTVNDHAFKSYLYNKYSPFGEVETLANKIIDLIEQKKMYVNIMVTMKQTLMQLEEKERKYLVLAFSKQFRNETIAGLLNISLTSTGRLRDRAVKKFLDILGRNEFFLAFAKNNFLSIKWLTDEYESTIAKNMLVKRGYFK